MICVAILISGICLFGTTAFIAYRDALRARP